jgi:protein MAK16
VQNIENELRERLRKGVYGDIYNIDFMKFKEILEMEKDEKVIVEDEKVTIILRTCRHTSFMF